MPDNNNLEQVADKNIQQVTLIPETLPETKVIRKFRPDIEGLRAIAVILVVLGHSGLGLRGGFIGVDIFFVISGFLITRIMFLEAIKTKTISLANFYARRIIRILPASIFVLLCTLLASFFWLSPLQFLNYATDGLWATFSVLNYRLAINGTDYFNTTAIPTPFQHYWSLCVEQQFYFIWPLVMVVLAKLFSKKSYFGNIVSAVLVVIIGISLYLSYTITSSSQPWAYFGLHTRAWQMAIGALLAINIQKFANLPTRLASLFSWIGFGGLIYALAIFTENTPYPSVWAMIPTLATAVIVASGVNFNKFSFESVFGIPVFQFVGKVSYSWYLVHWPMFVIFLLAGERNNFVDQIACVVISFFVAVVCYYIIENPIRHNIAIKSKLKNIYILSLCLLLFAGGITGSIIYLKTKNLENKNNLQNSSEQQKSIIPNKTIDTEGNLTKKMQGAINVKKLPQDLTPTIETASKDKPVGCIAVEKVEFVDSSNICVKGDVNSKKTIVLLGDSHAHQWQSPLDQIAKNTGYKLLIYVKAGCPIQDIKHINNILNRDYTECYSWRESALNQLETTKPDVIIYTGIMYANSNTEAYTKYIKRLSQIGSKLYNITDNVYPSKLIPDCLSQNANDISKCSFSLKTAIIAKKEKNLETEISKSFGSKVIETENLFCQNDLCPAIIDNIIVYQDKSHITNTYAKYLTNVLEQRLNLPK